MKENTALQERLAVHAMTRLPTVTRSMWLYLDHYMYSRSIAPSYRDLARRCGCSLGWVRTHLRRLEKEQIVMLFDGSHRCIRLLLRFPLPDSVPVGGMLTKDLPPQSFLPENSPMGHIRALLTHASLSESTQRVWYHLDSFMEGHGVVPTHRELGEVCECSSCNVRFHFKNLQIARVIQRVHKKPRAIRLLLRYPEHLRDQPFPPRESGTCGPGKQSKIPISFA